MIDRLERARDLVRGHRFPKRLGRLADEDGGIFYYDGTGTRFLSTDVTPEVISRSLHYMIKLKLTRVGEEYDVPLGISKYKGLPHLPSTSSWPAGQYFLAQLNLADLHPLDLYDAFPAEGMLYFFFDPGGEVTVTHFDGPLDRLSIVDYPEPATAFTGAKYYLDGFRKRSSLIAYRPKGVLYVGTDAYDFSSVRRLLPKDLRHQIREVLGGPIAARDTDCRIYGRPMYWQGEDELDDDDQGEVRHLLFQDEFGEGHIHVWIDHADAQRRDYSRCWFDYSGT